MLNFLNAISVFIRFRSVFAVD